MTTNPFTQLRFIAGDVLYSEDRNRYGNYSRHTFDKPRKRLEEWARKHHEELRRLGNKGKLSAKGEFVEWELEWEFQGPGLFVRLWASGYSLSAAVSRFINPIIEEKEDG